MTTQFLKRKSRTKAPSTLISILMENDLLLALRTVAERREMPYTTLLKSMLRQSLTSETAEEDETPYLPPVLLAKAKAQRAREYVESSLSNLGKAVEELAPIKGMERECWLAERQSESLHSLWQTISAGAKTKKETLELSGRGSGCRPKDSDFYIASGRLQLNSRSRWEIIGEVNGEASEVEVESESLIEVQIGDQWIATRFQRFQNRYQIDVRGLRLENGLLARIPRARE